MGLVGLNLVVYPIGSLSVKPQVASCRQRQNPVMGEHVFSCWLRYFPTRVRLTSRRETREDMRRR